MPRAQVQPPGATGIAPDPVFPRPANNEGEMT